MCICYVLGKIQGKFAYLQVDTLKSSVNSHAGKVRSDQYPRIFVVYSYHHNP